MSTKFYRFLILLSLSPFLSGKEGRCDNTSASLEDATEAPKKEKWFKKKKKQIEELVAENPTTTNVVAGSTLGGLGTGGILGVGAGVAATAGTGILAYKGAKAAGRKMVDITVKLEDRVLRDQLNKVLQTPQLKYDKDLKHKKIHEILQDRNLFWNRKEEFQKKTIFKHYVKRFRDFETYFLAVTRLDPTRESAPFEVMLEKFAKDQKISNREIRTGQKKLETHASKFNQMIDYHLFSHELPAERKKRIQDLKPTNPEEREKRKTYKAIDRHMRLLGK